MAIVPHYSIFHRKRKKNRDNTLTPNDSDVLCGRGGRTFSHPGNENYRQIIFQNKERYALCKKKDKVDISKDIVYSIRNQNPPSRFLEHNLDSSQWEELSEERAIAKVSQALREGQKYIKRSLEARTNPENVISTDKSPNRELYSDKVSYSSHSATPDKAASLSEFSYRRGEHEFPDANTANEERIRSQSDHGMPSYRSKKPSKLSSDSLCRFTTSREIPGSPIRMPGEKKMRSDSFKPMEDEKENIENINTSKSMSFDDFQLESQVLKPSSDGADQYEEDIKSSPDHAMTMSTTSEQHMEKAADGENVVNDEIEFIRQIFSED